MKKLLFTILISTAAVTSFVPTYADFFGSGNNGEWKQGPYGPYWDESDWPEWTPMYWMEQFMDEWDDNNGWNNNNFGFGNNLGAPYGGGYGNMPYGSYGAYPYYGGYNYPVAPYPTTPR